MWKQSDSFREPNSLMTCLVSMAPMKHDSNIPILGVSGPHKRIVMPPVRSAAMNQNTAKSKHGASATDTSAHVPPRQWTRGAGQSWPRTGYGGNCVWLRLPVAFFVVRPFCRGAWPTAALFRANQPSKCPTVAYKRVPILYCP